MSEIIEKIKFFRSLKLKPTSNDEKIKWANAMDRYLISLYNINECFVLIENIKKSVDSFDKSVVQGERIKKRPNSVIFTRFKTSKKEKMLLHVCMCI